jgi:CHAT domain-containing protein/tetratricopeptide (TPR) repeat protein
MSNIFGLSLTEVRHDQNNPKVAITSSPDNNKSTVIISMNESLKSSLRDKDFAKCKEIVDKILKSLNINVFPDSILSESYYLIGTYHLMANAGNDAIKFLNLCISVKEKNKEYDLVYANALNNLGVASYNRGDLNKFESYGLKSLEVRKKISGESDPTLIIAYLSLTIAYTELKQYEKALAISNIALNIASGNSGIVHPSNFAKLYFCIGVCYSRLADYSKARIYLEKAESIYSSENLEQNEDYINLLNSLAITYNALGFVEKSTEYYERGVKLAISMNSSLAYNIINSYSLFLAHDNKIKKGEQLLRDALIRAKTQSNSIPVNYYEVLSYYASYLYEYNIDVNKSIKCYEECLKYLEKNSQAQVLKTTVNLGYSLALNKMGKSAKALTILQSLLFPDRKSDSLSISLENPDLALITPDLNSLKILRAKYRILWDSYNKTPDERILEAASKTSELIVSLLDKVRINISEEDSRLILGDKYRVSYMDAIRDFNLLYNKTANYDYLESAFEFSEKTKVASLLTSTRELKAAQFQIPSEISSFERELQQKISLYNVRISEEIPRVPQNIALISNLKENLLETIRTRDSLIRVFEKKYPEYYAIKYNTRMVSLKDIPALLGHNGNYINYVVSDTVLYTFIVNRKFQKLLTLHIDSGFFNDIRHFRSLLSMPSPTDNSTIKFKEYQEVGYRLYKALIEPVASYFISDELFLSPDDILSYIPFETIPTSSVVLVSNRYKDLSYLMNKYDISYTYSATFMKESDRKEYGSSRKLVAFAPNYPEPIEIQTILMSRQAGNGVLNDLPYARKEAEYVSDITGGKLFENESASESAYKRESGKYDIIHLAMHALLNDKDPMHSTLVFSHKNDSLEDGYLKTFEIYGIPLKAKMVVLSSCNTGTGTLFSGEGILSLARGFIYSGCQSVVMSMWEIEDRSGTDVVERFYKNLKSGYSKSIALRNARRAFLKNADQLRSHPYFWSSLVIYGNNSPLYPPLYLKMIIGFATVILLFSLGYYFRKRKYS